MNENILSCKSFELPYFADTESASPSLLHYFFTHGRLRLKSTLIFFKVCVSHAELLINQREWQNYQHAVTPENEIFCVFLNFPCMIHAEMHIIWLSVLSSYPMWKFEEISVFPYDYLYFYLICYKAHKLCPIRYHTLNKAKKLLAVYLEKMFIVVCSFLSHYKQFRTFKKMLILFFLVFQQLEFTKSINFFI